MIVVYLNFHFATLEEYYLGTLLLPPCNLVSDGSVFMIALFLCNGIFGNNFWTYGLVDVTWLNAAGLGVLTCGQAFVLFIVTLGMFQAVLK